MLRSPKVWRHRLEYASFRLAEALTRAAPLEIASGVSGALWRRLGPLSRRHGRALAHLARAFPDSSAAERKAIADEMWETLGRTFVEIFRLHEIVDGDRLVLENEDYWRARAAEDGGGWIICSAHFGNWEAAAGGMRKIGRPTAGVYQKLSNPFVEARLRAMRDFLYPSGLFPKEVDSGPKILRSLRGRGALALLADLRDNRGPTIPFFGSPAPTSLFPATLARKLGASLFVVRILRRPRVRFVLSVAEIKVARTEDRQADIYAATRAIQRQIEEWIREAPGQWMWSHRRWG